MKASEQAIKEFAEKWGGVNNGEKHCEAPEDCYWRISDTNICTCPEVCTWNSDKADKFLSDLTALISEHYYPKEFTEWVMSELVKNNFDTYVHYVTKKGIAGVLELEFDTMDEAFNYWKENEI